ncbi:MAG: hypothetical protein IJ752_02075 [Alphaproteobacteria bacterium]|nr:hypothetical protein [Alphaproteobacteria bacterium]
MTVRFFSRLKKYITFFIKYLFFMFNLALLAGLSIKTVNLWIADPFNFSDTLSAFPEEPEFLNKYSAENQFWIALCIETVLFIIGGFLCYELLIKQKTFRRSLIAPIAVVFLWTAGESIQLFLPATEKAQQINTCKAMGISWDIKNHKCHLMDLELKRFEQLKTAKKRQTTRVKPSVPAAVPAQIGTKAVQSKKETAKSVAPIQPKQTIPSTQTAVKPAVQPKITPAKVPSKPKPSTVQSKKTPAVQPKKTKIAPIPKNEPPQKGSPKRAT